MLVAENDNGKLILLDDLNTVQVYIGEKKIWESKCWNNIKNLANLYLQFIIDEYVDDSKDNLELAILSEKYFK